MSNVVNVDFVTKVVEIQVKDTQEESLAAQAAINAAARAAEIVDEAETEIDDYTDTKKAEVAEVGQQYVDAAQTSASKAAASATAAAGSVTQTEAIKNAMLAGYGYPFTASTAADMTDTTKIYVYTGSETGYTNGDWYYYNGTDWTDGGVYNAIAFNTDPTLTVPGAAADAKMTGDILHSLEFGQKRFKIVENSYVNLSGVFSYSNDFSRSDYIECTDYSAIRITAPVGSAYNAFYDAQKTFISSFYVQAGSKIYNVPSNACYFAMSNTHEAMQQTKVETYLSSEILDAEGEIAITNDVINCLKTTEEYIKPFIDNKYIDNTDGSERNYPTWSATDYISTEKFDGYLRIKTNNACLYNAFYDSNKNFTRSFRVAVGDNLIRINSNEAYVRLSNTTVALESTILSSPIINNIGDISCGFVGDVVSLNPGMKEKILQANRNTNFTLLHLSDIHMYVPSLNCLVDVIKFYNKYSALIDDAVCTGDMVGQKFSDAYYTSVWDANGGGEILTCIGNHDCTEGGDSYGRVEHTQAEVYDKFIEPYVTGGNPSWGTVSYQENITYWYKDYASKGVRLISMNALLSGDEATAQNTWLQQTLAGAKTNGYSVIILTHYGPYNGVKVDCNFTDKIEPVLSGFKEMYQQSVQSFIDGGGDFVCYLSGHTHYDLICKNTNYPNQLFVVVTATYSGFPDLTKPKERFNILTFDKTRHIVKIIRVGQDRDEYMRHIGLITIDYKTLEVIYSE